mgnify:CR=1 FL=1
MALWSRRIAADKSIDRAKQHPTIDPLDRKNRLVNVGPSLAHELASDPTGIGFAFGGVTPGTLHAHGQLHKVHTVK